MPQVVPARQRPLPPIFLHRTPERSYYGTAEGGNGRQRGSECTLPPVRHHAQIPLHVLWVLVRTDFRARYRGQALGILWSLLNPLVMMGVLSMVFTRVFRSNTPHFPIFLLIGLLLWQWLSNSISAATQTFVHNADIIKRTIFARELLPIAAVLSYGINFCIESLVLLTFIPIFPDAFTLSPTLLLLPVFLLIFACLLSGVVLATSVLNVLYRDVAYLVSTALLILYWLTPVIYPIEVIPEPFQAILKCSPLTGILLAVRGAVMDGRAPTFLGWASMVVPTVLTLLIGWLIFRHYEHQVLDYV